MKQNDFLSWLIDSAPTGREQETDSLILRMLTVNFVALHTTSMVSRKWAYLEFKSLTFTVDEVIRARIVSFSFQDVIYCPTARRS